MTLRINDEVPDFSADTTEGPINFHDWIGNSWVVLFSHPKDFTPVCTTELGTVASLKPDFDSRNCKLIGISVDGVSDHASWSKDIESFQGTAVNYPLIGDPTLNIVKQFDMLPADDGDTAEGRTPADNATARSIFVIGPDKKIKATLKMLHAAQNIGSTALKFFPPFLPRRSSPRAAGVGRRGWVGAQFASGPY